MIPHSQPCLGDEEAAAAAEVVKSGYLANGPQTAALERELADFLGVQGVAACSSGTAALYLALSALGASSHTTVHIPSYVCTALWNAAHFCDAKISVCDVESPVGNLSVSEVLRRREKDDDIVILPYMFGSPATGLELKQAGFRLIEDCAQSIGASADGHLLGSIGQVSIFSFYATKVLCAGEGGAVASNSPEIMDFVRDFIDYDHKKDLLRRFNFKMTDLQAAVARIQLKKLPDFIVRRRKIAAEFDQAVLNTGYELIERPPGDIYFRYLIKTKDTAGTIARFRHYGVTAALPVYYPVHRYLKMDGFPQTEQLYRSLVSLPCYPALTDTEVETICAAIISSGSFCSSANVK